MATIGKNRGLMTLVNVFTVTPDKQSELADCWFARPMTPQAQPHMKAAALASFEPIIYEWSILSLRTSEEE